MTAKTKNPPDEKATSKLFKDWFDKKAATTMANQVASAYEEFDKTTFKRKALRQIDTLEFNDRVKQFASALHDTLPPSYPDAVNILTSSYPKQEVNADSVTDGWLQWPVGQFIADYGTDHFDESMDAMIALTQQFSSEFAVRPFIVRYPKETLSKLLDLTSHSNEHVRRWCSEGSRTRLPWGVKLHGLIDNPAPVWRILKKLIDDDSLYVRRSVANNINDLSKDHPEQVLKQCALWSKGNHPQRAWIIKHGLRGLIKAGNNDALALIGYSKPVKITANISASPKIVSIGESTQLNATLTNHSGKSQSLMIDYVVHYVRINKVNDGKVFKWKTIELKPGESNSITKKHAMKPTTIRALYKGVHTVDIQINGHRLAQTEFKLA